MANLINCFKLCNSKYANLDQCEWIYSSGMDSVERDGYKKRMTNQIRRFKLVILLSLLRCGRDSNSRPPAWQADILTDWTTAPRKLVTTSRGTLSGQPFCLSLEWLVSLSFAVAKLGGFFDSTKSFCNFFATFLIDFCFVLDYQGFVDEIFLCPNKPFTPLCPACGSRV